LVKLNSVDDLENKKGNIKENKSVTIKEKSATAFSNKKNIKKISKPR